MGSTIKCEKCEKIHRYDTSEIRNIGTMWHPIWSVECPNCQAQITADGGTLQVFDNAQFSNKREEIVIKINQPYATKRGRERAENSEIREYWIQEYVKENYAKLGFSDIEGPFEIGPDFKGLYKGKSVVVEVERGWQSFIRHNHHVDEHFAQVSILIVLNPSKPSKEKKVQLPEKIIYIDIDDFVAWWPKKVKTYAALQRAQAHMDLIAAWFRKRFLSDIISTCDDRDRDMSTCPHCDSCAYFGNGTGKELSFSIFQKIALEFIIFSNYSIASQEFRLSGITPSELEDFYKWYMSEDSE